MCLRGAWDTCLGTAGEGQPVPEPMALEQWVQPLGERTLPWGLGPALASGVPRWSVGSLDQLGLVLQESHCQAGGHHMPEAGGPAAPHGLCPRCVTGACLATALPTCMSFVNNCWPFTPKRLPPVQDACWWPGLAIPGLGLSCAALRRLSVWHWSCFLIVRPSPLFLQLYTQARERAAL